MAEEQMKYKFPSGFIWGTATSAHQIEGGNENNWTEWEQDGHIKDGSVSGRAANSYELHAEDIKLVKELNNNAYRFSIEWSRIEPQRGRWDKVELRHYQKIIEECRRNDIEPFVTLYHWTQPLWFAEMGGWLNKQSPLIFRNYVEQVVKFLGSGVTFWCTINEPMVYAYNSYWLGKWPPQGKSFFKFNQVINNLAQAHRLAYFILHEKNSRCQVGAAKNNQSDFWWGIKKNMQG